jgi:poly(3-hydroxybutyrate) depolymerase
MTRLTKIMLLPQLFGKARRILRWIRSADRAACRAAAGLVVFALNAVADAQSLGPLAVDPGHITVSGVSSGGFMALQFAVAHSAMVRGVGAIAAGPYYCARLDPLRISDICLRGHPDWRDSVQAVDAAAALGAIDSPSNLERMRGWLLAEGADPVVSVIVVEAARDFLRRYAGDRVQFRVLSGAGHSMPTVDHGGPCGDTGGSYLNACAFDAAAQMLDYLDPEAPADSDGGGDLLSFDQSEFVLGWRRIFGNASLGKVGYLFVPKRCRRGGCRLHVALHGCRQGADGTIPEFVRYAGYNAWAGRHATVVLYPQATPTRFAWYAPWLPLNPEGCWDWWGYSGADYAVRSGVQIRAIEAMIERLEQPLAR